MQLQTVRSFKIFRNSNVKTKQFNYNFYTFKLMLNIIRLWYFIIIPAVVIFKYYTFKYYYTLTFDASSKFKEDMKFWLNLYLIGLNIFVNIT